MTFKRYLATEVLFFLFVVSLSPLWLPVWLVWALKDWYYECRYGWECMERNRLHEEKLRASQDHQ